MKKICVVLALAVLVLSGVPLTIGSSAFDSPISPLATPTPGVERGSCCGLVPTLTPTPEPTLAPEARVEIAVVPATPAPPEVTVLDPTAVPGGAPVSGPVVVAQNLKPVSEPVVVAQNLKPVSEPVYCPRVGLCAR